jgi:hypothetical protein
VNEPIVPVNTILRAAEEAARSPHHSCADLACPFPQQTAAAMLFCEVFDSTRERMAIARLAQAQAPTSNTAEEITA